jgi:hypothetical protein
MESLHCSQQPNILAWRSGGATTATYVSCSKSSGYTAQSANHHCACALQCPVNMLASGLPKCLPAVCWNCSCLDTTLDCVVMMQCPINTWSAGGENIPCTQCPANTASPSTSKNVDACVCLPGYKPGASGCVQCVSGEVCPGGTSVGVVVIECPPGAISPPGSDSLADCVCQAGYGKLLMDRLFV